MRRLTLKAAFACVVVATYGCSSGGGATATAPTGEVTVEGMSVSLAGVTNSCVLATSGAAISTASATAPDAHPFLMLTLSPPEGGDYSALLNKGNIMDVEDVQASGGFDIADVTDSRAQIFSVNAACEVDLTWVSTDLATPVDTPERYSIAFDCQAVPYVIVDQANNNTPVGEGGCPTDC